MAFTKITNADLLNKGVVGLPDTPNLSTTEMQEKFDEIAKDVLVPKHNALIDELADIGAALNIGAIDPLGNPSTVQEQLNRQSESGYTKAEADMKFVAQEVGKQLSTEDFTTAEKDKLANLNNYVLPIGTDTTLGGVKADNTTFTIDSNGVGHAIGGGGGGGGSIDYNVFINKPKIGGIELIGDKSLADLGISTDKLVEITVEYAADIIGATLTCENGAEVYTFTADSSLSHTFLCIGLGEWTVSENIQDTSVTVNANYYGRYSCLVGGDIKIKVNFASDMVGKTITCTKGGDTKTKIAAGSSVTFSLQDEGTYTISENLNSTSKTVTVTHGSTKEVDFVASIQVSISDTDIGSTITCSDGTTTLTWVSDSTQHTFNVSKFGDWYFANTTVGVTHTVTVSDYSEYEVVIGGASIVLTITNDFFGETVTCTDGTTTKSWVCDSTTHTFAVGLGTWTISATVSGSTFSTSVEVTEYTSYNAELTMYGYQGWLTAGGITKTFSSLAEVLADEPTIRTLMNKQDAVDYLVLWLPMDNASLTTIINDNYCAKWINLRDYALDTLYANATIKTAMDTADKYFYGEWVERDGVWQAKGNVPIMTANNAPYGVASADGENASHSAYMAFDDNNTSYWSKSGVGKIIYTFTNPMCVKMFDYMGYDTDNTAKNYRVLGSNDGTTWTPITSGTLQNVGTLQHIKVSNDTYYLKIALDIVDMYGQTTNANAKTLQFYGRELKVSVPTMTGNTEPWGEVSASSYFNNSYLPYFAFNDNTNGWATTNADNENTITYDFGTDVLLRKVKLQTLSGTQNFGTTVCRIDGSSGDNVWHTVIDSVSMTVNTNNPIAYSDSTDNTPYRYYRVKYVSGISFALNRGIKVQFYGLDYSEHEERHYIYDHGVEVEEVETNIGGTIGTATKYGDNITLYRNGGSSTAYQEVVTTNSIDCTSYNLLRAVCFNLQSTLSSRYGTIGVVNSKSGRASTGVANSDIYNNIPNHINIDVSNVNAQIYPKIDLYIQNTSSFMQNLEINEMWLE